jgi:hypothetical protein
MRNLKDAATFFPFKWIDPGLNKENIETWRKIGLEDLLHFETKITGEKNVSRTGK